MPTMKPPWLMVVFALLMVLVGWPVDGVRADAGQSPVGSSAADAAGNAIEAKKKPSVDAEKILAQVDRKLRPESFELFAHVTSRAASGRTSQVSLYVVGGKGKKSAALILAPDNLLGRSILRLEDDLWVHMPGELELRSTSLDQSWAGAGFFNNADLLLTDFSVDYKATLLEEDADSLVLELTPRNTRQPYTRQVMRVDRKLLLPRSLQQYGANGLLLKTVTFDKVNDLFGSPRPSVMEAVGGAGGKQTATWQLGSIKPRTLPAETFTRDFLPKVGSLFK